MIDLIRESLSLHNLPVTMLLGMVTLYWLLVIVGVLDNDFDGGLDADVGDHHSLGGAGFGHGGMWSKRGRLLNFGEIPLSIIGSFVAIFMWLISMYGNFYLNGTPGNRSLLVALALLVPNALISLLLARIAVIPCQRIFQAMHRSSTEAEQAVGREARVVSMQVDEKYGQVEVPTKAVPLLVNARVEAGTAAIKRGAIVIITSSAEDGSYYYVSLLPTPEDHLPNPENP